MRRFLYQSLLALMIAGVVGCGDEAETGDTDSGVIPGTDSGTTPDGSINDGSIVGNDSGVEPDAGGNGNPDSGVEPDAGNEPDGGGEPDSGTEPDSVVWADVQPIFQSKCSGGGCHGSGANTTYSGTQATVNATLCGGSPIPRYECMLNLIKSNSMPSAFAVTLGRQRPTTDEIALIEAWVEAGAPEN